MSNVLHPQLLQDLLKLHQSMLAEGKLRARAQLEQYYSTFRTRFETQILANNNGNQCRNSLIEEKVTMLWGHCEINLTPV